MDQNERQAVAVIKTTIPSLMMSEEELMKVLAASIYPGAKPESIKLVIGYCRAGQLDPLQKPVHIVPMSVKVRAIERDAKDTYEWRDVIMPGVGLYRTQASRSGECMGVSEPEFGPDVEFKYGDQTITVPKSCRVTVKRLVQGHIVEFTAVELWEENYATAGRDTIAPNAMWKKRKYGQLAKCSEAQALRKAFPEFVGAAATAEELEGKTIDEVGVVEQSALPKPAAIEQPQSKTAQANPVAEPAAVNKSATTGEAKEAAPMTKGQMGVITTKLEMAGLSTSDFKKKFGCELEIGIKVHPQAILDWIANPTAA